jgi:hypothetical protein
MKLEDTLLASMESPMQGVLRPMAKLKEAAISNPDKNRSGKSASKGNRIQGFPMWDCAGGTTRELSTAGLLPGGPQRFDLDSLLVVAQSKMI